MIHKCNNTNPCLYEWLGIPTTTLDPEKIKPVVTQHLKMFHPDKRGDFVYLLSNPLSQDDHKRIVQIFYKAKEILLGPSSEQYRRDLFAGRIRETAENIELYRRSREAYRELLEIDAKKASMSEPVFLKWVNTQLVYKLNAQSERLEHSSGPSEELRALQAACSQLRTDNQTLRATCSQLRTENATFKSRDRHLTTILQEHKDRIASMQSTIATLKKQVSNEIDNSRFTIKQLNDRISWLEKEVKQSQSKVLDLSEENKQLKSQICDLNERISHLKEEIKSEELQIQLYEAGLHQRSRVPGLYQITRVMHVYSDDQDQKLNTPDQSVYLWFRSSDEMEYFVKNSKLVAKSIDFKGSIFNFDPEYYSDMDFSWLKVDRGQYLVQITPPSVDNEEGSCKDMVDQFCSLYNISEIPIHTTWFDPSENEFLDVKCMESNDCASSDESISLTI